MSRIGKQPITIPEGVRVAIADGVIEVQGVKGTLAQKIHDRVSIAQEGTALAISVVDTSEKQDKALWGLYGSLVRNMIEGVTQGFEKKLEVNGVGYKVALEGKNIVLHVGYSHPVPFSIPEGIVATVEKNTITLTGIDKQLVGEIAAQIRKVRKPEPYKGKGIKYSDEILRRKAGKAAKAA